MKERINNKKANGGDAMLLNPEDVAGVGVGVGVGGEDGMVETAS